MKLFKKPEPEVQSVSQKSDSKVILVVGSENSLYPFHLAHFLKNAYTADVLLVDNSISQDLFEAVPRNGNIGNAYEISVVSNRSATPAAFLKFDFVIVYLGYNKCPEYYACADRIILLSDYTLKSRRFMTDFDPEGLPVDVVFYNRVTGRVSERMLLDSMQKYDVKAGTEIFSLEFTEDDASGYICFSYDGFYALSKMSKEYQHTIEQIVARIMANNKNEPAIESEEEE